jgi:L-2-hydroxyglutarate oxidase LhgO
MKRNNVTVHFDRWVRTIEVKQQDIVLKVKTADEARHIAAQLVVAAHSMDEHTEGSDRALEQVGVL